ncbi:MAG: tetratricopeptide repeat protein [Gammaproteobacteria bacterium]|nr:tetratricopeptide repeat protein [Gammaproteobacteria bacterium]
MVNQSNTSNDILQNVRDKINEIEEKSASGDYIYRGEPEHHEEPPYYGKICSSLYRQYARIEADEFDIESIQGEILEEAKAYSHETDDPLEILTLLQHYGGKTNLIDFTTDHLIAIFFACDRSASLKEDGRLILLEKNEKRKKQILRPRNPRNRVIAQKSRFVRHPDGFLSPEDVEIITIPACLKQPLLTYLRKYHDISTETIYNDLHGFITNQHFHESAYSEFHRGLTSQLRGYEVENPEEKQAAYEKAIMHYSRALKLKPDLPDAFINRGDAYLGKGNFDPALTDFNKAIELNPNDADAYIYRGNAYLEQSNSEFALADFNKAIELNPNDADAYIIRGDAYLEQRNSKLALTDFDKAIELDPENANAYVIRGKVYGKNGDLDPAIEDYKKAIELDPNDAEAYYNLGLVWMQRQNWQEAKLNLTVAKILKANIVAEFHNAYESVTDFEQQNDIDLPEDIAAMLTA